MLAGARHPRVNVRIDELEGETGDRSQLDRDDVVLRPAAVREPRDVTAEQAEVVRLGGRRDP